MTKFLLSLLGLLLWTSSIAHPLYVSVTEIEFNSNKKRLEVSIKLFQDDLLKAIQARDESILEPCGEATTIQTLLENYLSENFGIVVNEKELKLTYLGSKCEENDLIYLFVSLDLKNKPEEMKVSNSLLFDQIDSQENIVNMKVSDKKRSLLLNSSRPVAKALFD